MTFALTPKSGRLFIISITIPLFFASGTVTPAIAAQSSAKPLSNLLGGSAVSKPSWAELNPTQQNILAPLNAEWDKMSGLAKKKWLEIANRYPAMKPDEQNRLQERMRDWVKLTPEQRTAARENYAKSTKLDAEHKSAQWQQYQQLSDEEKQRLATESVKKKSVTNLPSAALKNPTILAPIKVGPQPVKKTVPTYRVVTPPAVSPPTAASNVAAAPASSPDTSAASAASVAATITPPVQAPASSAADSTAASNPAPQSTGK